MHITDFKSTTCINLLWQMFFFLQFFQGIIKYFWQVGSLTPTLHIAKCFIWMWNFRHKTFSDHIISISGHTGRRVVPSCSSSFYYLQDNKYIFKVELFSPPAEGEPGYGMCHFLNRAKALCASSTQRRRSLERRWESRGRIVRCALTRLSSPPSLSACGSRKRKWGPRIPCATVSLRGR